MRQRANYETTYYKWQIFSYTRDIIAASFLSRNVKKRNKNYIYLQVLILKRENMFCIQISSQIEQTLLKGSFKLFLNIYSYKKMYYNNNVY